MYTRRTGIPCAHTSLTHTCAPGAPPICLAYQLLPSFLCLTSYRPGTLGAGLPRGLPKTTQITRGNVVISSQKAGGSGCGSRPPLPDLLPPSLSRRLSAVPCEPWTPLEMSPFDGWGLLSAFLALLCCTGEPGVPDGARASQDPLPFRQGRGSRS